MPASEQPSPALERIDDLDRNIHAPARLKIMACLAVVAEADFTFLLRQTGLTRGNLSPNLRKLEQAGYLAIRKGFVERVPHTVIKLTEKGMAALEIYRKGMEAVLADLLTE
jgi:DNA-binding MarR family transcriptional regulator